MTPVFHDANLHVDRTLAGTGQLYLVARVSRPAPTEQVAEMAYRVFAEQLRARSAEVVHERVFANVSELGTVLGARQRVWPDPPPVLPTCVEGAPVWGRGLAGVIIHAVVPTVTQSGVHTLLEGARPVGRRWRYGGVEQFVLQGVNGLGPDSGQADRGVDSELECLFDRIEHLLGAHGAHFGNVARTWFYFDEILPLYAAFNRVRSARYAAHGLLALPASTGIGGKSPGNARVVADVLATTGDCAERLASTTQKDPTSYGSAFSRGVKLPVHDQRIIQVSGTAAIGEHGESLYPGDIEAQIECTLMHVTSLLEAHRATLADAASVCMFLKRPEHGPVLAERLRRRALETLPCVVVVADVCRDELWFELDAEVVVPELR